MRYWHFIQLSRPKQWIKNIFVLAPLFFSENLFDGDRLYSSILAFIAFCLMSSSVYVLNDIVDREKDRNHPKKKNRPIAAGLIGPWSASLFGLVLFIVALYLGTLLGTYVISILSGYFLMNILYSFWLKNVVLIDIFIIAFGFVMRVLAGVYSIHVIPSPWLLLCTLLLALFLGLCKRKAELSILEEGAGSHRKILEEYSGKLLDQLISMVASAVIMAYSLYTFNSPQGTLMMMTIPFVLFALFRYLLLVDSKQSGGEPANVLFGDPYF